MIEEEKVDSNLTNENTFANKTIDVQNRSNTTQNKVSNDVLANDAGEEYTFLYWQ